MPKLTRTQKDALRHMQTTGRPQWPLGRGRMGIPRSDDARWTRPVLQGLVNAGHARWVHPTPGTHGVLSHIVLRTFVRVDSAYLYKIDRRLEVSTRHEYTDTRKPRLGPVEYLVYGHWLNGYHVSPTTPPKIGA